jgi:peptidyl-prolyl cis-trans isomerase C
MTFILILALAACSSGTGTIPVPSLTPVSISTPTVTPVPLVVSVNGQGFTVSEFEAELARYQQAQASLGNTVSQETATQAVSNDMIDTLLLEQGATASGFIVDDTAVQARIDALAAQVGGADALNAWEAAHGYSDTDFRSALRFLIAAAWMRDQVAASVPGTAEQVHARQILFYNAGDAQQALGFLQSGVNFDDLAVQYDPVTKGELGWFPRGYLPSTVIEDTVFALQPDQYSTVVQDETGYHILYVVERDPARQLSPDALLVLQQRAVQSWLTQQKNQSTILLAP